MLECEMGPRVYEYTSFHQLYMEWAAMYIKYLMSMSGQDKPLSSLLKRLYFAMLHIISGSVTYYILSNCIGQLRFLAYDMYTCRQNSFLVKTPCNTQAQGYQSSVIALQDYNKHIISSQPFVSTLLDPATTLIAVSLII